MKPLDPIIVYPLTYILFFVVLILAKRMNANRLFSDQGMTSRNGMLLMLHGAGIILLGIITPVVSGHSLPDILLGNSTAGDLSVIATGLMVLLALIVAPLVAEKKFGLMMLNKGSEAPLRPVFVVNYFISRALFLIAYELWFRGYLLTDCIIGMGLPAAIIVNIVMYALLHWVNGKDEMRGCIPLGLVLCLLSTWAGAAWPAIAVHIAMAVSYEAHLVKRIQKTSISIS